MVYVINANEKGIELLSLDNNYIVDVIVNELQNNEDVENYFNENCDSKELTSEFKDYSLVDIFSHVNNVLSLKEDRFTVMFFNDVWWVRENKNQEFKLLDIELHEDWDINFRNNLSTFARHMLFADRFAYYCFHALTRKTDNNGLTKNRYINNWAYSNIKDMVNHAETMVKFCNDNRCRLYAGVNARSSIKTALTIANDMSDFVNVELDNGSTFGVQGLRHIFGSASQRVVSRHPKNVNKFYMFDIDFKDETEDKRNEVIKAVNDLTDSEHGVKFTLVTTHGFHVVTTYINGEKYNEFRKVYGEYADAKKDPIVFIGNFS